VQRPTLPGVERLGRLVTVLGQVYKYCFIIWPLDGVRVLEVIFAQLRTRGEDARTGVRGRCTGQGQLSRYSGSNLF
jgi:hypothetical protein